MLLNIGSDCMKSSQIQCRCLYMLLSIISLEIDFVNV
jgi:hypothetical protein